MEPTTRWGRVLICGGTDWPKLGRKEKGGKSADAGGGEHPDLLSPHILRSLSNVRVVSIHASCAGCHVACIDVDGVAWLFGRNAFSALGVKSETVSENAPRRVSWKQLPGSSKGERAVHVACGRSHTLIVGSSGSVWTAGANASGQCGHAPCPEISAFRRIKTPSFGVDEEKVPERVIKAAAGVTFSILLAESGRVYAIGSTQAGQLGNGRTGEHIISAGKTGFDSISDPIPVKGLDGKKIVEIACGQQHTIARDADGFVYVWGYNGYCRLGLGNQQDVLIPKTVPQFAGPNQATMAARVFAGPTNSVVIDKQGMYWMAGKWKNTGDGSSGQPYSSFRYMQDIMGCKMEHAASGGVTHFALCPDEDGSVMTVGWGQNAANGELGLGADQPKSATKPQKVETLAGIAVFDIAAGQNTTLFLAAPGDALSDLSRHPVELDSPDSCIVCDADKDEDVPVLECEKCDRPYHITCLDPPLDAVPDDEWFCPDCVANPGAPVGAEALVQEDEEAENDADEDEEEDEAATGRGGAKRKAPAKGRDGAKKRQR